MPNGLGQGDSLRRTDTISFFRGERDPVSAGRRDVQLSAVIDFLLTQGFSQS